MIGLWVSESTRMQSSEEIHNSSSSVFVACIDCSPLDRLAWDGRLW